jgi:thiol-disulfide isomerase/thioredoxin
MFHALVVALSVASLGAASEKPNPAEQLKAAKKEVAEAQAAFVAACKLMSDPSQPDAATMGLFQTFRAKREAELATAWEIAVAQPLSDAGFEALELVLSVPGAIQLPSFKPALGLVTEHYLTSPKAARLIASLAYYRPSGCLPVADLLKTIAAKNPDRTVHGQIALGQAHELKKQYIMAAMKAEGDADRLALAAEQAFAAVLQDYADCPNFHDPRGGPTMATIGEEARAELFELRQLIVGRSAPDIQGEDLAGASFKLSNYRGKVVLLVFWASWCSICLRDIPHEQELVQHFKGRPFALIGVNGDYKREQALNTVAKRGVTWRSFWNGAGGPDGPMTTAWGVSGMPCVYVIDHRGVIREKYLRGKQLDEPLERLVTEAEAAK